MYREFLHTLGRLLDERKTQLLPKQVTVFTTNYDVFIEKAATDVAGVRLNDGFNRESVLDSDYVFAPEQYFNVMRVSGNLFNYSFSLPSINLVKVHGSLTWRKVGDNIYFRNCVADVPSADEGDFDARRSEFLDQYILIQPTREKFQMTLLERVYYDLLRIFANVMEIENSVMIAFGFSFEDEHILDITRRALKTQHFFLLSFHTAPMGRVNI